MEEGNQGFPKRLIVIILCCGFLILILIAMIFLNKRKQDQRSPTVGPAMQEEDIPLPEPEKGKISAKPTADSFSQSEVAGVDVVLQDLPSDFVSSDILVSFPADKLEFKQASVAVQSLNISAFQKREGLIIITLVKTQGDDFKEPGFKLEFLPKSQGEVKVMLLAEDGRDKSIFVDSENNIYELEPTEVVVNIR